MGTKLFPPFYPLKKFDLFICSQFSVAHNTPGDRDGWITVIYYRTVLKKLIPVYA